MQAEAAPRARVRLAWLAGFALTTFFSFPQELGGRVLDLGLVLAWLGPACLLLGLRGLATGRAAAWGFGAGIVAYGAVLHWLYVIVRVHAAGPAWLGLLAVATFALYSGLFTGVFGALASRLGNSTATPLLLAALFATTDHLRSVVVTGFPWVTLGYAQHANPALMGLAPWTGVYGLSFAAALGGAAAAALVQGRRRSAVTAAAALVTLHAAGAALLALEDGADAAAPGRTVRVAIAQGNIPQSAKWAEQWKDRTLAIYEELTREAARRGADLALWPETAVPGAPEEDATLAARLASLVGGAGVGVVTGAVGVEHRFDAHGVRPHYLDSAFVLDAGGAILDRYDKTHLVAFGEYFPRPFRPIVRLFMEPVATGNLPGEVSPGSAIRALAVPGPEGETILAGIPICFELLFPDLVRRFAGEGAEVLLAITNDIHFGRTGGAHQFLRMSKLRSAETRRWMARSANSGISAFIDPWGRVHERRGLDERGLLVADLPLRADRTFYVRHGDAFVAACWAGVLLGLAGATLRARRAA